VTINDLRAEFRAAGIRGDAYCLDCDRDEAYCLKSCGGRWFVYYSERGLKTGVQEFATEDAACQCLQSMILNDPTTLR
jgi:hypothetical protein